MQTTPLNDNQLDLLMAKIREDLQAFPTKNSNLCSELESAARHLPAYVKIVRTHIEQLKAVLATSNHKNQTLESVGIAPCVTQIIKLFDVLGEDDTRFIEELALAAREWNNNEESQEADIRAAKTVTEHS